MKSKLIGCTNYGIKTYRMDPLSNPNLKDGPIMKSRFKGWNHYGNPFSGYGLTMKPQNGASSTEHPLEHITATMWNLNEI